MPAFGPIRLLAVLCCGQLVSGSPVSLVQGGMRVHQAPPTAKTTYLMDNSELQHSGPGMLLRRSKSLEDTADRHKYVRWGDVIEAEDVDDDWVKYEGYYLPKRFHGAQVLTQHIEEAPESVALERKAEVNASVTQRRRSRPGWTFASTEFQTGNGVWQLCDILREGTLPDTYDIQVKPRSFSAYNITNVPAVSLKKVQRIRKFIPMKARKQSELKLDRKADEESRATVRLQVNDTKANVLMDLKIMKKSPMRTIMKMACEKAKISWFVCSKRVNFIWQGNPVHQDETTKDLGMADGQTLLMVR